MRLRVRTNLPTGLGGLLLAAALVGPASSVAAADLERGEQLYVLCQQCHGAAGGGNPEALAPAIAGLADWYVQAQVGKFQQGIRGTHFDDLAGMRMRPMSMWLRSEEDVAAVSAYVAQLAPTTPEVTLEGGDAANGAALYTPCIACHAADGSGNSALSGAPLSNQSDWYLFKQMQNFKAGIRGADPRDQMGALMRAMSSTLVTDQAVKDVIAHIQTLSK